MSRALDAEIATKVMGRPSTYVPPPYSTDIAAAWLVVAKMRSELWSVTITDLFDGKSFHLDKYRCRFVGFDSEASAEALSPAAAICRAALVAVKGAQG